MPRKQRIGAPAYLRNVWQVHLNAVLRLVHVQVHDLKLALPVFSKPAHHRRQQQGRRVEASGDTHRGHQLLPHGAIHVEFAHRCVAHCSARHGTATVREAKGS